MKVVEFSRCLLCKQISSRAVLEPDAVLPGVVCIDKSACKDRLAKSQQLEAVEKDGHTRMMNGEHS